MKPIKFISLILSLTIVLLCSGQAKLKVGAAGGLNYANLAGSDVSGNKTLMGFNGGLITEIKLPIKLGVEADILFSMKGSSFNSSPVFPGGDYKLSYIDVPVVAKLYMARVLNLQLGGQFSVLTGATFLGADNKDQVKPTDLSAVMGIGVDVSVLHISCRYNYGLTSIDESGADVKNNMLTLSVGLWLKK